MAPIVPAPAAVRRDPLLSVGHRREEPSAWHGRTQCRWSWKRWWVRLEQTASSARAEIRAALRARIVLAAAGGGSNAEIARDQGVSVNTVRKWRRRFAATGLAGLRDAPRPGRPLVHGPDVRVAVVATATNAPPHPECGETPSRPPAWPSAYAANGERTWRAGTGS
ncbi:helix-turn-helix domain-containing protein [Streptomyces inhibens]|uniref:helix-turn-helix domain-containing protein n=1 Tax=Streptomyces inhibens TaxID=2293571 RepID=UPI00402ACCA1